MSFTSVRKTHSKVVDFDIEVLNDAAFETTPHVSITGYHSFDQSLIPGAVLVFDRQVSTNTKWTYFDLVPILLSMCMNDLKIYHLVTTLIRLSPATTDRLARINIPVIIRSFTSRLLVLSRTELSAPR